VGSGVLFACNTAVSAAVAAASVARAPAAIVIQDLLKGAKANQQGCRTGSAPSWDRGLDRAGWIEFVMLRQKKNSAVYVGLGLLESKHGLRDETFGRWN
jgi:hypothetical protein